MATKYHINPKTGNPNKCTAKPGNCPFGSTTIHYTTQAKARKAYEGLARAAYEAQEEAKRATAAPKKKKPARPAEPVEDNPFGAVEDSWLTAEPLSSADLQPGQVVHVVGNLMVSTIPLQDEWTKDKLWETMVITPDSKEIFVRHSDSEKESVRDHALAITHAQKVAPVYRQAGEAEDRESMEEAQAFMADHPTVEIRINEAAPHDVRINGEAFPVQSVASARAVERTIEAGLWHHAVAFKDDFEHYVTFLEWDDSRLIEFQEDLEELLDSTEAPSEEDDFLVAQKDYIQVAIAAQVKAYERDREETRDILSTLMPQKVD